MTVALKNPKLDGDVRKKVQHILGKNPEINDFPSLAEMHESKLN